MRTEVNSEAMEKLGRELGREVIKEAARPTQSVMLVSAIGHAAPTFQPSGLSAVAWTVLRDGIIVENARKFDEDGNWLEVVRVISLFQFVAPP